MTRKRIKVWAAASLAVLGLAAFTTWGFDPASWRATDRFMFGITLICLPLLAAAFPFTGDNA